MKHKHAECIKAWADGEAIEAFNPEYQKWMATLQPGWFPDVEYRIKNQPKLVNMYVYYAKSDAKIWIDDNPPEKFIYSDLYTYVGRIEIFK